MKDKFLEIYRQNVSRLGADKLLAWLESTDFFEAPASTASIWPGPAGWWNTASMFLSGSCGCIRPKNGAGRSG